jgi:hypothetical protein
VALASSGDTIQVCMGAYPENVTVNKTLNLLGAQAGNSVTLRVFSSPAESTVTGITPSGNVPVFLVAATNVTIDGFSVTNSVTAGAAQGIAVKVAATGAMLANNMIDMINTPDTGVNGTAQAIYLEAGPDNVSILGNEMSKIHSNRSAKGVLIGDSSSTNPSQNIVISGNSITDVTSDARGAYGVQINNGNGSTANSGLQIRSNTVSRLTGGGWAHAIGLEANTPGVIVRDNSISNVVATSSTDRIAVWFEANPSFSTGHVNYNNLDVTIADYGIAVQPTLTGPDVDGTCNWWGAPNGPGPVGLGAGAMVSPKVDYIPWLIAPAPSGACLGVPPPATLTLAPATATNAVGNQHCVIATVKDAFGSPVSGIVVRFSVTPPTFRTPSSGSATTNSSGQATFCYTSALPGADLIHAYADTDNNGVQGPGEPFGEATKAWVLPVSTPCEVKITDGGWIIAMNGDRANFGGNAKDTANSDPTGNQEYQDQGPLTPMNVKAINVLAITCTSDFKQATIFGDATIDGAGTYVYRIDVEDNAEPGAGADKYEIRLSTGYDSGLQTLQGGNIQIHN